MQLIARMAAENISQLNALLFIIHHYKDSDIH